MPLRTMPSIVTPAIPRPPPRGDDGTLLLTLLQVLDSTDSLTEATERLIARTRAALGADAVALLAAIDGAPPTVRQATDPALRGLRLHPEARLLRRARRLHDLHCPDWGAPLPAALAGYRALLTATVDVPTGPPLALACLSRRAAAFGPADRALLQRIAAIASHGLDRLRLSRRNAVLAGLIDGTAPPAAAADHFDAPFEAVTRAVDRLTRAQATAAEITNDLLRAPSDGVDAAIVRALARTGALAGSDRTYVFRLRPPDRLDNTHEWTAPGIAPMISRLQDLPDTLMDSWRADFGADREVYVPDVLALPSHTPIREVLEMQGIRSLLVVPTHHDGRLTGFVGYDAVRAARSFLPGEIFLLRSVATVISTLLERRAAERTATRARTALHSERRRQQARLAATTAQALAARARLAAAVEALQDGFAIFDSEDRLLLCNPPYRDCYPRSAHLVVPGVRFADLLRQRLADGEYPDAAGNEAAWLAERLTMRRRPVSETEQQLTNGRWVRGLEKATPDGGRVALRVDITALKAAEKRALEERAAAMEASRDGISIIDAQGRFIYMNRAHRTLFGLPEDSDIGTLRWEDLYTPETAAWFHRSAIPTLRRRGHWQGEADGHHRDGRSVEQELSLTLQADGSVVCITRDISQRRRDEAERTRLREELQLAQRREVAGQLAAGLAHDFNNILAVISGSAGVIEARQGPAGPDAADALRIRQAAGRAIALVARLRDLGRHGRATATTIDLRRPLGEAADLLRSALPQAHRLVLSLPAAPLVVHADPVDVLQVALNLALNARDALGPGPNSITLSLTAGDGQMPDRPPDLGRCPVGRPAVTLRVADTGKGMAPDTRARVFEPWFSTKGRRGTGLGLAVVAGIVCANDAALWLDSAPGDGTTVTILWPVAPATARPEPALPDGGAVRLDGLNLLVVDDAEAVCEVLAAVLEQAGAEVAIATDPMDARDAIVEDPDHWAALITDHDMPGLSGSALAHAALQAAPGLPVVLVSARPDTIPDALLFDAVLEKPVAPASLVAAVARAVAARRARTVPPCAS